jgi:hypothetical protein
LPALTDILWGRRASVAWLALAVLGLRSASFVFGLLNIDECDFALIARTVRAGGLLYVDVADLKPPLAYLAYLPAAFLGDAAMRVLGAAVVLGTALLLRAAARRWTGSEEVGWAAAWCALAAGLVEVPSVNAEVLMNLPSAAALYLYVRAEREGRRGLDLLAGGCAGLASLCKHQAAILVVALGAALLLLGWRERRGPWARLALLAAGFALPWAGALAAWAALGHAPEFIDWVVARNVGYVGTGATSPWPRLLLALAVCVLGAAPLPWFLALREARGPAEPVRTALVLLLGLTWLPVSAGGRFYEHYFLQFVPPLALLAAPQAVALGRRAGALSRRARVVLAVLLVAPVAGYLAFTLGRGVAGRYPGQNPTARAAAAWIDAHSAPSDRMLVWGHFSPVYCLARRLPGTRFISTAWHAGNFDPEHLPPGFDFAPFVSRRDVALTLGDLERNRPALFVDTGPADLHRWSLFPLARFPELDTYVRAHYRLEASPGGVEVWRRIGETGPVR